MGLRRPVAREPRRHEPRRRDDTRRLEDEADPLESVVFYCWRGGFVWCLVNLADTGRAGAGTQGAHTAWEPRTQHGDHTQTTLQSRSKNL